MLYANLILKAHLQSLLTRATGLFILCVVEPSLISYSNAKIKDFKEPQSVYHSALHFNLVGLNTYRNPQFNQGSGLTISINVKIKGIISD